MSLKLLFEVGIVKLLRTGVTYCFKALSQNRVLQTPQHCAMAQSAIVDSGSTSWRSLTTTWHVVAIDYWSLRKDIPKSVSDVDVRNPWLYLCSSRRAENLPDFKYQPLHCEMVWVEPADPIKTSPGETHDVRHYNLEVRGTLGDSSAGIDGLVTVRNRTCLQGCHRLHYVELGPCGDGPSRETVPP